MAVVLGQKLVWVLLVLGNVVTISLQASTRSSDSYVAAVVEYAPVSGATLENKDEIFMQNVAVYGCIMEQAAKQDVDIIVFPEIGLASYGVPRNPDGTPSLAFYVPEPGANPCDDNSSEIAQGLKELSCSARRHSLYAVVNLPERINCTGCPCPGFPVTVDGEECPPSGAYFHNTNVVFDRSGTIVARYRKFHLFGEPGFVPTQQPEFAIFETDFGVTFGTFICFDIMFARPAAELVREHSICDFAFPSAWFSEVPFLTAVQTQAAWAHSMDVNLLAAGYDKPEAGSSGSGIFLGRSGALQSVMPNATTSQLLVGTVPKMRRCQESAAAKARCHRAAPDSDAFPPEGDDEEHAEERTPLSAFHHIVHQRKRGHLDAEVENEDESVPAFIHHTMYDHDGAAEGDGDDDDSQPPSGEYETKVPPHFMGLQQVDQGEVDDEQGCSENGVAERAEGDASHGSSPYRDEQVGGIPEKKIPTSTDTDEDPYGFSQPSQNPDLLKLYQDEPVEQFPEEFLEIEVPEERYFEPEPDHEYFKLSAEAEIPQVNEQLPEGFLDIEVPEAPSFLPEPEQEYYKLSAEGGSDEKASQQVPQTDEAATAAGDSADPSVPRLEEEKETGRKDVDAAEWEESGDISERTYDEERNATEQEIEDTRKQFEWLTDEKDDSIPRESPEQVQDVSSAPPACEEAHTHDHIDDTDDVLGDDHGLHLLDDSGHVEEVPRDEHIDDTDDVLVDDHGMHLLEGGGQNEAPTQDHVDDTDDVLPPEDHAVGEPDAIAAADTSQKLEGGSGGELAEEPKADALADNKQPAKSPCKLKKRAQRRGTWHSRRDRLKRNTGECKCKQRPEEQKSSGEADGSVTDDKPVTDTSEEAPECGAEDTQPEETQPEEQFTNGGDFNFEAVAEDTQPDEQPTDGDDFNVEAVAEDTHFEEEPAKSDDFDLQPLAEGTQQDQLAKGDDEAGGSKPKRPCRVRERREATCPAFSEGVLDDGRVNKSTVGLFLKRDHLETYKTFTLNTDTLIENSTVILCHGTFCCNFHVVLEVNGELDEPRYAYRLAVFDGVRTFDDVATGGLQVCAVIPCSHEDMDSCGILTLPEEASYSTVFRTISVSGIFSTNHTLVTANSVGPGLLPLPPDKFNMTSVPLNEGAARVTLMTTASVQEEGVSLFSFGIYSRIFNRDGQPATAPS